MLVAPKESERRHNETGDQITPRECVAQERNGTSTRLHLNGSLTGRRASRPRCVLPVLSGSRSLSLGHDEKPTKPSLLTIGDPHSFARALRSLALR